MPRQPGRGPSRPHRTEATKLRDLKEFRDHLIVADVPDGDLEYRKTVFLERVLDILSAGEVLDGAQVCRWQGTGQRGRKAAVSAAAFHAEDGSLSLVLGHFDGSPDDPPTLQSSEASKLFRALTAFLAAALEGVLDDKVPAGDAVAELLTALRTLNRRRCCPAAGSAERRAARIAQDYLHRAWGEL